MTTCRFKITEKQHLNRKKCRKTAKTAFIIPESGILRWGNPEYADAWDDPYRREYTAEHWAESYEYFQRKWGNRPE